MLGQVFTGHLPSGSHAPKFGFPQEQLAADRCPPAGHTAWPIELEWALVSGAHVPDRVVWQRLDHLKWLDHNAHHIKELNRHQPEVSTSGFNFFFASGVSARMSLCQLAWSTVLASLETSSRRSIFRQMPSAKPYMPLGQVMARSKNYVDSPQRRA